MSRSITSCCLALFCLFPALLSATEHNPLMWLEPISREEIRAQRAKKKAAMAQAGPADKQRHAGRDKGKKRGAGSYMLRSYYIRSSPFPQQSVMQHQAKGGMAHGGQHPAAMVKNRLEAPTLWVKSPDNLIKAFKAKRRGPATMVAFPAGSGGWYDLFAYHDQGVVTGSRVFRYSFATFMSHGEAADRQEATTPEGAGYFQGRPILEIKRLCADNHECYRTYAGQKLRIQASFKGQPLPGKPLTLVTEQGWRQTKKTDALGKATFTLIKELFPENIDRRKSENYLLSMTHTLPNMGELNGQHFHTEQHIATLPLKVHPSPLDWQSRSMAYLIGSGTFIVAAGAIAIRRKRKRKTS
jgi:hypothetical protein